MRYLLIFCFSLVAFGQSVPTRRLNFQPVAAGGAAFNMGLTTLAATDDVWSAQQNFANLYTASASGTLQKAVIYYNGTGIYLTKVAVYGPDTDNAAGSEDVLIATSGVLTGTGSAGWVTNTFSGGTITSGQKYWIVVMVSATSPDVHILTENSVTLYYENAANHYASPPANISTFTQTGAYGRMSCFVTAQ